jgi:hypothetical protein
MVGSRTNRFSYALLFLSLGIFVFSAVAFADTVSSTTAGAQWVTNTGPVASGGIPPTPPPGVFFWDNASYDAGSASAKCNVGYFLNGTQSGCGAATTFVNPPFPGSNLSFLAANAAGTADVTNVIFSNSSGDTATFRAAITFNNGVTSAFPDVFGWYNTATPAILNPLFSTASLGTTTATFAPSGSWGFYIQNGSNVYLSGSDGQQFALFARTPSSPGAVPSTLTQYWLGVEDTKNTSFKYGITGGDYDYNDMIIEFGAAVPEPAYLIVFLAGFTALILFRRSRSVT